ncbi:MULTISPECIES: carbohydrate kinase family protein [unclassified Cellulophaga]|uniref:carbohydrate kinase family protein n=1 Tax=unclassified Cellulophaga TaxID=2634405 RepID=UPI0026E1EF56|nr:MULTISPECIES: carbohydrate kinase [unclassified Cellulophaga]MDO6492521.1 carbohydrate kinase [Cellulophaga sp. 2_MG-2023]MDO6493623.1 carbohydrate kinase [Cellulophaga sp. 3_MG-2023]
MKKIVCFGEVLWDIFPTHKKIGGAPLNVALRLNSLHNNVSIISKIGDDENGELIKKYIQKQGVNINNLQVDDTLHTGEVKVLLNAKGSATYDIQFPRAWDNIVLTNNTEEIAKSSDAFIYGSLVARDTTSRDTLYSLLRLAKFKIFDVNLRSPYYTTEVLNYLMKEASFIKFNDDEIFEITANLNLKTQSLEESIKFIALKTNTKSICVTKGSNGAILYYNSIFYYNSGYQIDVVDTVGAGDSFLGTLINKLLAKDNPQKAIDYACAVGALVAGSEGANPKITNKEIDEFMLQK